MGEGHHHHRFLLHQPRSIPASSRLPKGGGEIVEVEGGHIVRSTGRKDRHSKVCTAKGPRDRRVRLSAHTAIQFYDVQDRLGYDRPSKAVDWLIKNAKAAIDELAKLPPWHPTADPSPPAPEQRTQNHETETSDPADYAFGGSSSSFLPPSLDSDSIADTIKSFFPITGAAASSSSSPIGFHAQDLRLSLQSFQDPILLHHHHHQPSSTRTTTGEQTFFSTSDTPLVYDTTTSASWSEQHTRMVPWSTSADTAGGYGGGRGGYAYNLPPPSNEPPLGMPLHSMVGQSLFLSQRGPLQSSDPPSTRAWMDPTTTSAAVATTGFASGGFSGFRIPARIQGEEEHDGVSDKPSSASRR